MSPPLAATVMVQEQLGLALNRNGEGEKAERVFKHLLEQRGSSSETYGILGRVYKEKIVGKQRNKKVILFWQKVY